MAPMQDAEVKGTITFELPVKTTYRYVLQLKDQKMSIWMEDRMSKKQWYKGGMDKATYVTSANAIPDATSIDYIKCFQDCLDCDLDECSDVHREFTTLNGGALRLTLSLKVRVLRSAWVAKYAFDLDPVSVERIDVLESKLKDQQDELAKLRADLKTVQTPVYIQLEAMKVTETNKLHWNRVDSDDFIVTGSEIRVRCDGVYSITGIISLGGTGIGRSELIKNEKCIQVSYASKQGSSVVNYITLLEQDDVLEIGSNWDVSPASYLSIVRLGC